MTSEDFTKAKSLLEDIQAMQTILDKIKNKHTWYRLKSSDGNDPYGVELPKRVLHRMVGMLIDEIDECKTQFKDL